MGSIWLLPAAYLLGSIPTGYWLVWMVKGLDVRTQGSGNIGMTNVWRVAGPFWGVLTLLLDIAKGALAIWAARYFFPMDSLAAIGAAVGVLAGNVFTLFLGFKGGKGIGVSVGVFFSLLPLESAWGTAAFVLVVLVTRMISAGSLTGVSVMALSALWVLGPQPFPLFALLAALLVWWTHRENIKRILSGTENRIGKKQKGKKK
ncbi:MAG TPA: glycerol-3-phosphate 1-O-acyltransferase PlsY [bacterium]|nr:glycerol-3-phosphate 1-O-acyltransferase PlsY [bacterium]